MTTDFEIIKPIQFIIEIEKIILSVNSATKKVTTVFNIITAIIIGIVLLLFLPFALIIANGTFYYLSKKINSIKGESSLVINKLSFNEVMELHGFLNLLIELTDVLLVNKKSFLLIGSPLKSMRSDAAYINEICKSKFLFSKEDMKMSDNDFKIYQESLSAFNDVWNYEDSEEDFKHTFNHKKAIA